jgi:Zn-dependent peptidase ImmA (M78 family)
LKIQQNISRLKYLLNLYKLPADKLLVMINEGLKKPISPQELFADQINVSSLKRIDKIFNKGLHYYLDPKSPEISKDASIFFRKHKFGVDLNIGAKKIVNQFEEFKISLSAIAKLSELNIDRTLPVYKLQQHPKSVAIELRKQLYPDFRIDQKEFLKGLIGKFAAHNILVFEFVETWNKKERANIDGFFLNPNVIVLKRHQNSFRREIFTLVHELGHFLLDEEEVEQLDIQSMASHKLSAIERWCNDFAYYFLVGDYDGVIQNINNANASNDYHFDIIETVSTNTHLSKIALFTRLLFQNKISQNNYNEIKTDFDEHFKLKQEEEKKNRELEKQEGGKQSGSVAKPINSPLLVSTIQTAFYEGIINEYEVCKTLNIKPDRLEYFLK